MAGGPAFLRSEEELSTRLCYVCFDGMDALHESYKLGLDTPISEDFLKQYCTNVYEGIKVRFNPDIFAMNTGVLANWYTYSLLLWLV